MKRTSRMSVVILALTLALAFGLISCGESGDSGDTGEGGSSGQGGASSDPFELGFGGAVRGEKGSKLTLRRPDDSEEQIGSDVLFGWIGGSHLGGNYFKQLRIGTELGVMELRMSFPGDAPPTRLIEGVHDLRPNRLLLEDSADLAAVDVEIFFQQSDPPFAPLTNARGTVEIRENINVAEETYAIAGEMDITLNGTDGTHQITGYFWARDIDP